MDINLDFLKPLYELVQNEEVQKKLENGKALLVPGCGQQHSDGQSDPFRYRSHHCRPCRPSSPRRSHLWPPRRLSQRSWSWRLRSSLIRLRGSFHRLWSPLVGVRIASRTQRHRLLRAEHRRFAATGRLASGFFLLQQSCRRRRSGYQWSRVLVVITFLMLRGQQLNWTRISSCYTAPNANQPQRSINEDFGTQD